MRIGKLNIALDIDGTLVDTFTPITNYMEILTGKRIEHPVGYSLEEDYQCSAKIVDQAIDKALQNWIHIRPMPYALELWKGLWEATHDPITLVTARRLDHATETYQMINAIFGTKIPYRIAFSHGKMSKFPYLQDFQYFVEDNGHAAWSLAMAGMDVFLLEKSHNEDQRNHPRIQPIHSLQILVEMKGLFVTGCWSPE